MPEQPDQILHPLNRDKRKQLLILACGADRALWRQACTAPAGRSPAAQLALRILGYVEPVLDFLPGRLGRVLRGANFLTHIGRHFGWLKL